MGPPAPRYPDAPDLAEALTRQQAWMKRLARAFVRDAHDAEDLVQEASRAALETPPAGHESLRGWLAAVMRNAARMSARARRARNDRELSTARGEALPSADDLAAQAEAQRAAVDELLRLPEPYRRALLLHFLHELSAAEIARRNGEPAASVRARIARGLLELRQRMDRRHGGAREGWRALLAAPLGAPPIPWTPGNPATSQPNAGLAAALAGILAMKTLVAVLVSAATLTIAVIAWRGLDSPTAGEPAAGIAAPAPQPAAVLAQAEAAAEPASRASERAALQDTFAITETPPAAASLPLTFEPALLRAVVVDSTGASIAGALLDVPGRADVLPERSGAAGVVQVEVPMSLPEERVVARLAADGFATHVQHATILPGEVLDLGTVTLEAGVLLIGQVVDPEGTPLGGARVWTEPEELPDYEPDWLARKGIGVDLFDAEDAELRNVRSAVAGPDGRFELHGVPARSVRLWGSAEEHRFGWTDVLELAPGAHPDEIRLVLEPLQPTDFIAGVVQAPDGTPFQAWIQYAFETESLHLSSGLTTAGDGTFRLVLWGTVPVDFTARAPDEGSSADWSDVRVRDVTPGTHDLVLRFAESAELEVKVIDGAGRAVDEFGLMVAAADDQYESLWSSAQSHHSGGIARVAVPGEPFTVRVNSSTHRPRRSERLDPLALPDSLTLALEDLPMLHGRFVDGDAAIQGARIELMKTLGDIPQQLHVDGLPAMMMYEWGLEKATSASDGAFRLGYLEAGTYYLVADAEGFARAIAGPLRLDPARVPDPLTIELGPGGALDVRVVLADGSDPVGRVVGITCGDGDPRSTRVGADGYARFAGLTPGPWFVQAIEAEISPSSRVSTSSATNDGEPMTIEWSCEVREGRTTLYVLELAE